MADGPGGVVAVSGADHGARVLPGRALCAARASRRPGPGRLVARARRPDRARLRPRHRLRLHHHRADPDSGCHLFALDRALPGGVRVRLARADAGARHPPSSRPRRRRGEPAAPPRSAHRLPGRDRLRARRRGFPCQRSRSRARRARNHASGVTARRADPHRGRFRRAHRPRRRRSGPSQRCSRSPGAAHDRPARSQGRVRAGAGRAALRAAAADSVRVRTGR